ncbi:nucleoporin Nup35 [Anopheles moucheti]|uniref:nucleoporin Nup35 n=1 Tax=Anopheles moucheti TaxID=186751 RepID=UPI0022F04812|nr:nucleoporin Nup35 [Anopheles moucheti]
MEPMTLGSPSGSSLSGVTGAGTGYLPSFLMGDPPTTPRPTTLSPTRGRSSLAYLHGLMSSPSDGLRSPTMLNQQQQQQQHPHQQQQQHHQQLSSSFMHPQTPQSHHVPHSQRYLHNPQPAQAANLTNHFRNESFDANSSITGPPTQGLFDSWRKEKQLMQTPIRTSNERTTGGNPADQTAPQNQPFNESLLNQSGFNLSRVMSPIPIATDYNRNSSITSSPTPSPFGAQTQVQQAAKSCNWVTVFGFPQNAASKILSHFIGIGTIVDKQAPSPQNGNWVHLRYSSRLECDRALNYNGRVISQGLMIGVQYCNDPAIVGKENDGNENNDTTQQAVSSPDKPLWRVRSLMNMSYTAMQDPQAVISTPPVQKRGTGIVNKAMDLFFGW